MKTDDLIRQKEEELFSLKEDKKMFPESYPKKKEEKTLIFKNIILSFLLVFYSLVSTAQSNMYCREFYLTDNGINVTFSDTVCYTSPVEIERHSDSITIITDSLVLRFVILYHQKYDNNDERLLASLVGQPGQVYSVNKRIDPAGRFFLTCKPIRLNARFGKIQGIVLEMSNVEICDKN